MAVSISNIVGICVARNDLRSSVQIGFDDLIRRLSMTTNLGNKEKSSHVPEVEIQNRSQPSHSHHLRCTLTVGTMRILALFQKASRRPRRGSLHKAFGFVVAESGGEARFETKKRHLTTHFFYHRMFLLSAIHQECHHRISRYEKVEGIHVSRCSNRRVRHLS